MFTNWKEMVLKNDNFSASFKQKVVKTFFTIVSSKPYKRGASNEQAAVLFDQAGIEWHDILIMLNYHFKLFSFIVDEPKTQIIDKKYLTAVSVENVVAFIASQSMEKIKVRD